MHLTRLEFRSRTFERNWHSNNPLETFYVPYIRWHDTQDKQIICKFKLLLISLIHELYISESRVIEAQSWTLQDFTFKTSSIIKYVRILSICKCLIYVLVVERYIFGFYINFMRIVRQRQETHFNIIKISFYVTLFYNIYQPVRLFLVCVCVCNKCTSKWQCNKCRDDIYELRYIRNKLSVMQKKKVKIV